MLRNTRFDCSAPMLSALVSIVHSFPYFESKIKLNFLQRDLTNHVARSCEKDILSIMISVQNQSWVVGRQVC